MHHPIVLFDGVCNLCNGLVRFLYPRDKGEQLYFTPLQSRTAQDVMRKFAFSSDDFDTFLLVEGKRLYTRSAAALRLVRYLSFPWPLLTVFTLVPPFLRDVFYSFIARNRYHWFGQLDTCPLPTPELQARFLD